MVNRKTPLAWKNLTHDWRRLAIAMGGICFAVLLMFVQTGFQHALFDSQVKLIDDLDPEAADILMVSEARYVLPKGRRFPRARLFQALAEEEVLAAIPIYLEAEVGLLKKDNHASQYIRVIGCDVTARPLRSAGLQAHWEDLRRPNTAVIDVASTHKKFPFAMHDVQQLRQEGAELMGRRLQLRGTFRMGTDFATEGNLLMSKENFAAYFPSRNVGGDPLDVVDVGVLDVAEGADPVQVAATLRRKLPSDVRILPRSRFREAEIGFWNESTPIGRIFRTGTMMGFLVGVIICYQIIFSDISDHMPEFATLKAMGYRSNYFIQLIVIEAIYLSLLGFVPGALLSWGIYKVIAAKTGLLMSMLPVTRILWILVLTMAMCVVSGLLAVRKLLQADPADLF
jgi:putative ABC transport system permease protein